MNPPKMPLHIGDYRRDTGHLRAAGHGAYLLLLMHYWSTGGLPDDDDQLAAIACMTKHQWKKHRDILKKFFDIGWRKKRIDDDLKKSIEKYQHLAINGKLGGEAKAKAIANAKQLLEQSPSNIVANHLTLNLKEERKKDPAEEAAPKEIIAADPNSPAELERRLYERGKGVLGKKSGSLITDLLKKKGGNVALTMAAIETASTKYDPRAYVGGMLAKKDEDEREMNGPYPVISF